MLLFLVVSLAFGLAGTLVSGPARFWMGLLCGATLSMFVALRESPPFHIEKWQQGSDGERRTARALRSLPRDRWSMWHDQSGGGKTNVDHVVLGDAGLFLLDTKNYSGEGHVENGEFRVTWLEDPDDGWTCPSIAGRMRGAAAGLKDRITAATGERPWVQPVVVLWMRFPQRVVEADGVWFVHGDALVEWLESRNSSSRNLDGEAVARFLDLVPAAT